MKIVFSTDNYWPRISGMAVAIDAFKDGLADLGHQVYILAPDYPNAGEFDKKVVNAYIRRIPSIRLFFLEEDRFVSPFQKRAIFTALRSIRPDIIHVHTEFSMGKYSSQYAKKYNIPLIFTAHTYWEEYANYISFLPKFVIKKVGENIRNLPFKYDGLITVPSSAMKKVLLSYGEESAITVIPTGIVEDEFSGATKKNKTEIGKIADINIDFRNKYILLFVGRIGIEKNIDFLIEVVAKIIKIIPNVVFLIVGDGPYREDLQKKIKQKKVDHCIFFTGYIKREKLKYMYTYADVFIFASKTEAQGLVIIESMQCGTPVVAVGEMGIKDIMGNNLGGFMVEDNLVEFCEKTLLLLQDQNIYQQKSREALQYAGKWNNHTSALKMQAVYQSVLPAGRQRI
jgi:glycosyltransferase involved in cell wall biosynthesis